MFIAINSANFSMQTTTAAAATTAATQAIDDNICAIDAITGEGAGGGGGK